MFQRLRGRGRFLAAAAPAVVALALAGCEPTISRNDPLKAARPLSQKTLSDLESKEMVKSSPILVRIYKQESELEVWKKTKSGRYALFKTYPICKWSGDLGPKQREGDRQAPEGFYQITPAHMNPNSSYYLSFDMGYPNRYDRAFNRTGSNLMVHGDCSSRGCYAVTDEAIAEIDALAREAFAGGQAAFQVQALPFRMTAENFAKHRNNPNVAFWKMLKDGVDQFEVTKLEPKVDVCERRYVFNARFKAPATTPNASPIAPIAADPNGKCPTYDVDPELAQQVAARKQAFEQRFAELAPSMQVAPVHSGIDGGMHPEFLAKGMTPPGPARVGLPGRPPALAYAPAPAATPVVVTGPESGPITVVAKPPAAAPVIASAPVAKPAETQPVVAAKPVPVSKPVLASKPIAAPPAAEKPTAVAAVPPPSTEMVAKPDAERSTVGKLFDKINPWSKN